MTDEPTPAPYREQGYQAARDIITGHDATTTAIAWTAVTAFADALGLPN